MQHTIILLLLLLPSATFGQSVTLTEDMIYCLESEDPQLILSSPAGHVTVTSEQGPMRVRGKFHDSGGRVESRTLAKAHLYFIEAAKPGRIELIIVPLGVQSEGEIERLWVTVVMGQGPQPPPDPKPEPDPTPEPILNVSVIVVEDVLKRSPETAKILNAIATWNEFADNGNDWRFYDVGTTEPRGIEAVQQAKTETLPALLIRDKVSGRFLRKMPLPTTVDSLKRIVREVAGD